MILNFICSFDLVVKLLESDNIAEQVLKPGCKHIAPRLKLFILAEAPYVHLESALEAVARAGCQVVADPASRVKDVVLIGHVCRHIVVFPALTRLVHL